MMKKRDPLFLSGMIGLLLIVGFIGVSDHKPVRPQPVLGAAAPVSLTGGCSKTLHTAKISRQPVGSLALVMM